MSVRHTFAALAVVASISATAGAAPNRQAKSLAIFKPMSVVNKSIGKYRWTVRHFKDTTGLNNDYDQLTLRDGMGRTVAVTSGHEVTYDETRDLTGDKVPELMFHTWSGGAHGSIINYIYSLGPAPRCLLVYNKADIIDDDDMDLVDLDGDGRQEIISWYDGFAYWGCSYAGSARIPIVLAYKGRRYVDATPRFRKRLKTKLAETTDWLRKTTDGQDANKPLTGDAFSSIVQWYAIDSLLHGRRQATRDTFQHIRKIDRAEFRRRKPTIDLILHNRRLRYAYPPVYHVVDINALMHKREAPSFAVELDHIDPPED